jgi:hypothetical protein
MMLVKQIASPCVLQQSQEEAPSVTYFFSLAI